MTDDELIAQLCLRIGMIMEDVCGEAVMAQAGDREALIVVVRNLAEVSGRIAAVIEAAQAMLNDG